MATATQKLPICDLPAVLLLKILVLCGPIATAHVSTVLSVLVRTEMDGRRLVDAVAVALISTFSDELSCEYDARWPWLYHAARLMGLLPNKPHPVWLLSTPNVPRVPPSWFLRAVFCQQAAEVGDGFPIDLTVLRKMYAIFGMPYTDPAHSQPAWLSFEEGFPVGRWGTELAGTPLVRFLEDLGQFLHKLSCQTFAMDSQTRCRATCHPMSLMPHSAYTCPTRRAFRLGFLNPRRSLEARTMTVRTMIMSRRRWRR